MSQATSFGCPSCGGEVTAHGAETQVRCPYCGKSVSVPEALRGKPPAPATDVAPPPANYKPARPRSSGCAAGTSIVALIVAGLVVFALFGTEILDGNPSSAPAVAPVERSLDGTLPRAARYAGVEFRVTRAVISNQDPRASSNAPEYLADRAYAILDLTLVNDTPDDVYLAPNLARLKLGAGVYDEDSGWSDSVAAQSTRQVTWRFAVPIAAAWDGAELTLAHAGKEPARIPLTGSPDARRFPVELPAGGEAAAQQVTYTILSASLDLDAAGQRADLGRRYLKLQMRFNNASTFAGGFALIPDDFRLIVDGLPLAPVKSPIQVLSAASVAEGQVIFDLPAAAREAALQVGEVGRGDTALISLDMPAVP